jgi:uncharacterized protein (TIGR02266 family)
MRRLLVVANDRALTKFVAEAMLGRSLGTSPPRASDPWDIARAHTGLEAYLLVTRGGRPFDAIVVDHGLPDQEAIDLIDQLRKAESATDVPIFVMSERGRDQHARRIASDRYQVAGFIEKPVTAESIRSTLANLERKKRILLVESNRDLSDRYLFGLQSAGYLTELAERGRDALDRAPRFRPDVVITALALEDMRGVDVCVELKKSRLESLPVVLYGQVQALGNTEISENAHRADDFIQAPFDDGILVERVAALIGRGVSVVQKRPKSPARAQAKKEEDRTIEGEQPPTSVTQDSPHDALISDQPPAPPPPSASPAAIGPTKRSTRRVPCQISMSIRNGEQVYTSKTLDISHGGIFVATERQLPIGTVIDMTFQIPNTAKVVTAVGKVAWVGRAPDGATGSSTAGCGVKFSKIDPADLQVIVDYVNRVSRVVYSAS